MSLLELFRPKPALSDPDRTNGREARHKSAYTALNDLSRDLELSESFYYGMGVEDLYERLLVVARAASVELKKR